MKEMILGFAILVAFSIMMLTGCTISIIQTDTHGSATDVVDSTPQTTAETDANVSLPVKAI